MSNGRPSPRVLLSAIALASLTLLSCGDGAERYAPFDDGGAQTNAAVVAGTVRTADGPVENVIVAMEPTVNGVAASVIAHRDAAAPGKTPAPAAVSSRRVTATDAAGRFAFAGVAAGDYAVQFIADDHLGAFRAVEVPVALLDTVIVDVNLTPTGTFSGVALLENAVSHQGTVVYAQGTSYVAVTDPAGNYALTDVPVGGYTVRAEHAHYLEDTESGAITMAGENVALAAMLLRINSNIPPVATISSAAPLYEGTPVSFTASGSDADGVVLLYEWDWEDDGIFDHADSLSGNANHTYSQGTYRAKFRVTDDKGSIGLAVIDLNIGPPLPDAIYVSASTGNDVNPGTIVSPVKTLAMGYTRAIATNAEDILVEAATYNEVPNFLPGINVRGGYNLPLWTEGAGYSTFQTGTQRATASNIAVATLIRRVRLVRNSSPTGNVIALYALNSNFNLEFDTCWFTAGNAGNGTAGGNGTPGLSGSAGAPGQPGTCDGAHGLGGNGGGSPVGCLGGAGGRGGLAGSNAGLTGVTGLCSGGNGGSGGSGGDPGNDGLNGSAGGPGFSGSNGNSASPAGTIVSNEWTPFTSTSGTTGGNGRGGGGGGGGGGQGCTFCDNGGGNGGGGGGGGGQAGTGGNGGSGGYGSFAVLLVASSPQFTSCTFEAGNGGNGGAGGAGRPGGAGGSGAPGALACTSEIGEGGDGGDGGDGGHGGGGAGGPGGPSYCVYRANGSAPALIGSSYNLGSGGSGGPGGTGPSGNAPAGSNGPSGSLF